MTEGIVTYDIRFLATAPVSGELIRLIINIEAQNDFYPGYPLIKRGIYYCSRMISAQYGTEFTKSHYEDIKKVYSIWICMNPPKNLLLSTDTDSKDKCQILEEDFHIEMTQTLESEVSLMCNLSKGVEERGIQKGIQKGIDKGITAMILTLKELQISSDVILKQICEKFGLTEETAETYLKEIR